MSLILSGTDGLSDVDGTAATPALRGTDANTGIFFGADIIGFSEGGVEAARINADSQFVAAAGTAALPVITTTGDVNTGIFFPAADTIAFTEGGAESMRIDSSGNVGIGTTSTTQKFNVVGGRSRFQANSDFFSLQIEGASGAGQYYIGATNEASPSLVFSNVGGNERMRIDTSGNLLVGTTSTDITAVGIRLMNNNQLQASKSSDWSFRMGRTTSTGIITEIYYNTNRVGDIATNGTGTSYNSASDYRLKENVELMTGALAKVAALKPVTYKWKLDGSDGQGFIAHELAEVVPDAVRGTKDEIDADGNPAYQGIDTSFLVATLTAAIQEQQALILSLTDRITALETPSADNPPQGATP